MITLLNRKRWALEWKLQDFWIGAYWDRVWSWVPGRSDLGIWRTDVWICLLPCLPVHVWWENKVGKWPAETTKRTEA